jgi:tRNA(Arg) A34 adenosine deaminase TadA
MAVTTEDHAGMAAAIAAARAGTEAGQAPFGCAIALGGRVLAAGHNTVWRDGDPTRHAEVNVIGAACRELGSISLAGATLYATCEPCPMCFAAAHWARVGRIVWGASIADAQAAGFNELAIPAERLRALGGTGVELVAGFRADDCRALFRDWRELGRGRAY